MPRSGKYVVRIEIGWWIALPHNKAFKFTSDISERTALLKAAGLAIVQPYSVLWREEDGREEREILYKGDEWTDPGYQDTYRRIREEEKNGNHNTHQAN